MAKKAKRKSRLQPGSDVLQGLFCKSKKPMGMAFRLWHLRMKWEETVGEAVAACCNPTALKARTLIVSVNNSNALHNLLFVKEDIIKNVNKVWGDASQQITKISFRVDSSTTTVKPYRRPVSK